MGQKPQRDFKREPVAILGVGCRFPGANDLDSFWRILRDGKETIGDYPGGRFDSLDRFYSGEPGEPSAPVTRRGGFLRGLDLFDAGFFGMSPREAVLLDPQQRLLLEMAWEALEDAGLPLSDIAGSRTGVFVGQWTSDYEECLHESAESPHFYSTTGTGRYAAAGRLAYSFDLRGPNLTLDTGCSSSLVAVHLACQSLRSGESDLALAGAVNVILRPEITMAYGSAGMLSADGRCKFGDAAADGYVRSEAGGVVVLKLLRQAIVDGDPIYAVIRGTAVNNDGASSGLLVSPSREGQAAMIRDALTDAGLSSADLQYIEAHGTGTAAGDPVELDALATVLRDSGRSQPCWVGSVKTNIGHTEAAAGMAGLCKVITALQHDQIPASLHFHNPTHAVQWDQLPLSVNREIRPWGYDGHRIAGVNSLGITGTNAHAIVENAPIVADRKPNCGLSFLFVLSARSDAALEQVADSWRQRMVEDPAWPASLDDLAFTSAVRRTHHSHRLALVARNRSELNTQLCSWLAHEPTDFISTGKILQPSPRLVFVYPGQGGQWTGMGRGLLEQEPVFREMLKSCDQALRPHTGWSVIEEILAPPTSTAEDIDRVQPTLFALMVALTELWRSWGVEPEAVVGHSMGEVAAAVACGALSLEDGAAVIAHRSRLMKTERGRGLMAMAALTFAEATELVRPYGGRISIAANNSPSSTVLAGETAAVEEVIAALEVQEIFCRRVQVDVASHCAQMDPIAPELERVVASIAPRKSRIPLYSTSTGRVEDGTTLDALYWRRNLREPVLFAGAVEQLIRDEFGAFVEINAHPVLLRAIEEGATHLSRKVVGVASLRRDRDDRAEMLAAFGQLYAAGVGFDFRRLYPEGRCLRLPRYPWQRERHWPEESLGTRKRFRRAGFHSHLGSGIELSQESGSVLFEVDFEPPKDTLEAHAWCLAIVQAAGFSLVAADALNLEDVVFGMLPSSADAAQLVVTRTARDGLRFCLTAKTLGAWRTCCEGGMRPEKDGLNSRILVPATEPTVLGDGGAARLCLLAAAQAVGRANRDSEWRVMRVERIKIERSEDGGGMRTIAMPDPRDKLTADAETKSLAGNTLAQISRAQFSVAQKSHSSGHIYDWSWSATEFRSSRQMGGNVLLCGDATANKQIAQRFRDRGRSVSIATNVTSSPTISEFSPISRCDVVWMAGERSSEPAIALETVSEIASLVRLSGADRILRLWIVTRGAQTVGHETFLPSASHSAVWGLAKTITVERPELHCTAVDLSADPGSDELDQLADLIGSTAREEQIAIRGVHAYVLRLEHWQERHAGALTLRKDGAYVVTGGFGGLGLALANFLAQHGAGAIALIARRAPSKAEVASLAAIEQCGARVRSFRTDVAEESALVVVLHEIRSTMGPLRGIFHLAGITEDALLSEFCRESLERVMRGKVAGAWNLHRLTANLDLDYFVLYSSLAAVSGQPGQASYASSNAYLDGLARLRIAQGRPAISMQWGPWDAAGMITEGGANRSRQAWAEQGIVSMTTQASLDAVERLLASPTPVALIARVNWNRFGDAFGNQMSAAFSHLGKQTTSDPEMNFGDRLKMLPVEERAIALESHLRGIIAAALKSKPFRIDSTSRFGTFGVDSLMAVEIARRITQTLGFRLPVTVVFNFSTLELLTQEVARRLELQAEASVQIASDEKTQDRAPAASPSPIAEMSEDDALQSLVKGASAS